MKEFYEVVVSYDKMQSGGSLKRVKDKYLVKAEGCADAEYRTLQALAGSDIREIEACRKKKFAELITEPVGEWWYAARLCLWSLDEKTGTEKKLLQSILVQSSSLGEALGLVKSKMSDSLSDYEIVSLVKTSYEDVLYVEA